MGKFDEFKFSVAIGVIYAVIMVAGLSAVHWNEPERIVSRSHP